MQDSYRAKGAAVETVEILSSSSESEANETNPSVKSRAPEHARNVVRERNTVISTVLELERPAKRRRDEKEVMIYLGFLLPKICEVYC